MGPMDIDRNTAAAVAAGILDPRAMTEQYTNRQMAAEFFPSSKSLEGTSLTDIVLDLREEEGER